MNNLLCPRTVIGHSCIKKQMDSRQGHAAMTAMVKSLLYYETIDNTVALR